MLSARFCVRCEKSNIRKNRVVQCSRCEQYTCAPCIESAARSRTVNSRRDFKCRNCSAPLPVQEASVSKIVPVAAAFASGPHKCHDSDCQGFLEPPSVHDTNFWECHLCGSKTCILCFRNHPHNRRCNGRRRILTSPRWKLRCASCYDMTSRKITDLRRLTVCTECNWSFCTICRKYRDTKDLGWSPCRCEKALRVAKLGARMCAYAVGLPLAMSAILVASPALLILQAVRYEDSSPNDIIERHLELDAEVPQEIETGLDPDFPAWSRA